jgi:hypothetical protein
MADFTVQQGKRYRAKLPSGFSSGSSATPLSNRDCVRQAFPKSLSQAAAQPGTQKPFGPGQTRRQPSLIKFLRLSRSLLERVGNRHPPLDRRKSRYTGNVSRARRPDQLQTVCCCHNAVKRAISLRIRSAAFRSTARPTAKESSISEGQGGTALWELVRLGRAYVAPVGRRPDLPFSNRRPFLDAAKPYPLLVESLRPKHSGH